jgi:signal transduction histidine kinase
MAGSLAESVGVRLERAGTEPAPEVALDRGRIEEALDHLLRNAVQAAGKDGVVRLGWFKEGDRAGFLVEDSGPGIPAKQRERVMEPFFTTKAVGEGSGLGLAVVHGIVEEHGGRIELFDSNLGGAGVRVILPVSSDGETGT